MWVCSKCGEKLEDNFDACWKCGTQREGVAPAKEEISAEASNNNEGVTKKLEQSNIFWEQRKEIGLLKALWLTTKQILFKPGNFFENLIDRDDSSGAFSFYFSFNIALIIIEIIVAIPLLVLTKNLTINLVSSLLPFFIVAIILIPVAIVIGIYIFSAVMHLFVLLFRGESGFNGTFNVMAYSFPLVELVSILAVIFSTAVMFLLVFIPMPSVFRLIGPFLGGLILLSGLFWMVAVVVIGYKRIHGFGVIRASCAFLIPILILSLIQYTVNKKEREKEPQNLEESLKRLEKAKTEAYEAKAKASLTSISTGCQAYFKEKGQYPSSLGDLENATPPYITSELVKTNSPTSAIDGYYYVYEFIDKNHFTLYARSIESEILGGKIFFTDQSAILRLDGPSGALVEKTDSLTRDLEELKSTDPKNRAMAAYWLGEGGTKEAVQPLINALQDKNIEVRVKAVEALGKIKDASAVEPVLVALKDENENLRWAVARALGEIKDKRAVDPLIMAIGDKNSSVRYASIRALGNIGDDRAVEPIINIVKTGDEKSREYAIITLGELKDSRSIDILIIALKDKEFVIRRYAEEALGKIGKDAIGPLMSALIDENKDFRYAAAEALGKIGDLAVDPLIKTLKEGDVRSRAYAAYALGKTGSTRATDALMAALKDEDKTVREFAAGAFRDIKDPSAVDVLVSALNDHENSVQCQAAYALADIRDTSVIDPLVSELKKGGDNYYVAYVLGSIGQPAVGSLINGLRGKGDLARFGAIQGLEKAKDMQTVEPLINALGDQDETIKKFANEALKKITGKDFEGNQKAWQIWWEQNKKGK